MFEQATLNDGPGGVRAWTAFLGLTSQVALVSVAVMLPMLWPQVLPTARILETLAPPLPPAPPHLGDTTHRMPSRPITVRPGFFPGPLVQPALIPRGPVPILTDEPSGLYVPGMQPGMGGPETGVIGGVFQSLSDAMPVAPPRIPVPAAATPVPPAAIPRLREGGNVALGALLHRVEPSYPALARAARVSGPVELECVVGTDGHIREVKVKSGNPLLVRAAVDAAWQWVYGPSKLNGVPIEIITMLTFTFKLN